MLLVSRGHSASFIKKEEYTFRVKMNNSTTSNQYTTTRIPSTQHLIPLINPISAVAFYKWSCLITLPFGLIGNIASLLTFSRPTLRKMSVGCLYITLAISDIFFLLVFIIDFLEYGWKVIFLLFYFIKNISKLFFLSLKVQFDKNIDYDAFCRFRSFIFPFTQLCSAWILVFISIDRWIRIRLPFKAAYLCTPKKTLFVVAIFLVIDIAINSHILAPWFGMLAPGVIGLSCGGKASENFNYTIFYYYTWPVIQVRTMKSKIEI
jgi:hypothetical protein